MHAKDAHSGNKLINTLCPKCRRAGIRRQWEHATTKLTFFKARGLSGSRSFLFLIRTRYLSCAGEGNWGSSLKSDSNRNFVTSRSPNTFWKQEAANRRLKEISLPNALGIADSNRFLFQPMPDLSIAINFSSSPWQMIMFFVVVFPEEDQKDRFCYTCEGGVTEETKLVIEQLTLILGTNPT